MDDDQPQPDNSWNSTVLNWLGYAPQPTKVIPQTDQPQTPHVNPGDAGIIGGLLTGVGLGGVKGGAAALGASKAIIAGLKAKGANQSAYHEAMGDLLGGKSWEGVHNRTKWFPRDENTIGYEIPDTNMQSMPLPKTSGGWEGAYEKAISNPDVLNAYPQLKNYRVKIDPNMPEGTGEHVPGLITVGGPVFEKGMSPYQLASAAHEGQHAVAKIEGWSPGNNVDTMHSLAKNTLQDEFYRAVPGGRDHREIADALKQLHLTKDDYNPVGFQMYKGLPSENEAFNINNRFLLGRTGYRMTDPQQQSYPEFARAFTRSGGSIQPYRPNPQDVAYRLKNAEGQIIDPRDLDLSMRYHYSRLPSNFNALGQQLGTYKGTHIGDPKMDMIGNPRYPWTTEDTPRHLLQDWTKKPPTVQQITEMLKRTK